MAVNAEPPEELIPLPEAAERLGVGLRAVQAMCKDGRLPVYEISPHRRYVVWSAITGEARRMADRQASLATAQRARREAHAQQRRAERQRQRAAGQRGKRATMEEPRDQPDA